MWLSVTFWPLKGSFLTISRNWLDLPTIFVTITSRGDSELSNGVRHAYGQFFYKKAGNRETVGSVCCQWTVRRQLHLLLREQSAKVGIEGHFPSRSLPFQNSFLDKKEAEKNVAEFARARNAQTALEIPISFDPGQRLKRNQGHRFRRLRPQS